MASRESIVPAPGEHRPPDFGSPGDAAFARLAAVLVVVAERRERRRVAVVQRRQPGWEQADQRRVCRRDDGGPARCATRG
jgi:hypothetical protein